MRNLLFVLFLWLPSVAFGQAYNFVIDNSVYPSDSNNASFIPLNPSQAVLVFAYKPSGPLTSSSVVEYARIVPSVVRDSRSENAVGWYRTVIYNDVKCTEYSMVVDAANLYSRSGNNVIFINSLIPQIQNIFVSSGLGTVEQRAAYIAGFQAKPPQLLNPGDILGIFTGMLGPWAYALVGLWIALIGLDVGTRSMTKTVGQAAKEQRKAERAAINYEKSHDPTARYYETKLKNQARFIYRISGDRDSSVSISDLRRQFRETAREYADYQRERGWIR